MKPIKELEALAPEQIDMDDPEIPETLKIRARNAMQKARQAHYELSEAERLERMTYEREAQEGPDGQGTCR
ncbi:MAG TPA: hypothetical protein H9790_03970 [Candidatus Agathobaculum intestinipullorum]|nr:hypothetical protein [Candidatus Agathobaculum intestinipullorum]